MHEHSFTPLLVVVGAAMLTELLLPRLQLLRIPLVVGEILIGILLGRSGVGLIPEQPDPWLELLSLFGFAVWALYDAGSQLLALIMAGLTLVHYALSYDRVAWLIRSSGTMNT